MRCRFGTVFLLGVLCLVPDSVRGRGAGLKSGYTSPLDAFVHRLDEHKYWLESQLKSEKATLNEVANYPNDDESNLLYENMNSNDQQMTMHYMKLAQMNVHNVLETGKCKTPSRRCVDMHRLNSGVGKRYWPPCALVHKCEHDSGCCIAQGHVCSPTDTKPIDLHFISFTLKDHGRNSRGRVERFTFENHTECGCRPASKTSALNLWGDKKTDEKPFDYNSCRCPRHFVPSEVDKKCVCVCRKRETERKKKVCRRIIRGRRSYHSDGCKKKQCDPPVCEYGEYKSPFSRCPRKNERIRRKKSVVE